MRPEAFETMFLERRVSCSPSKILGCWFCHLNTSTLLAPVVISDWREDKVEVESGRECSPPPPAAGLHDVFADTTNSPPAPPSPHPVLPLHLPLHLHLARARHPGLASRRWRTLLAHISLFFSFRLLAHRQRFTLSTQRRRSGEFLDRYRNPFFLNFFWRSWDIN